MNCPSCGAANPAGANRCSSCGQFIGHANPTIPIGGRSPAPTSKRRWIWGIIAALALTAAILCPVMWSAISALRTQPTIAVTPTKVAPTMVPTVVQPTATPTSSVTPTDTPTPSPTAIPSPTSTPTLLDMLNQHTWYSTDNTGWIASDWLVKKSDTQTWVPMDQMQPVSDQFNYYGWTLGSSLDNDGNHGGSGTETPTLRWAKVVPFKDYAIVLKVKIPLNQGNCLGLGTVRTADPQQFFLGYKFTLMCEGNYEIHAGHIDGWNSPIWSKPFNNDGNIHTYILFAVGEKIGLVDIPDGGSPTSVWTTNSLYASGGVFAADDWKTQISYLSFSVIDLTHISSSELKQLTPSPNS